MLKLLPQLGHLDMVKKGEASQGGDDGTGKLPLTHEEHVVVSHL